ncbi:hypothetical protein ILUMI_27065 [Ignelater luminosus]|uniref:Protein DPCD n=1 Tax=Ignelater luminosus TaxID=2038154 RepID=A0A8K0C5M7_IGNLU|nr:hypothetical protein ILUMI_27065 [Ignelater luminosus]
MTDWLTTFKNAKKTCIQQGNFRKVDYNLPNGKEVIEEYNMDTGVVNRRAWEIKKDLGGEDQWLTELGDPEPPGLSDERVLIKENASQPFVRRRVTKRSIEWRIHNLPYPIDTYRVTVEQKAKCLTVRTTNKKYFKKLQIPEFERLNILPQQNKISVQHKFNTLIITHEKILRKPYSMKLSLIPKNEGKMDCKLG